MYNVYYSLRLLMITNRLCLIHTFPSMQYSLGAGLGLKIDPRWTLGSPMIIFLEREGGLLHEGFCRVAGWVGSPRKILLADTPIGPIKCLLCHWVNPGLSLFINYIYYIDIIEIAPDIREIMFYFAPPTSSFRFSTR